MLGPRRALPPSLAHYVFQSAPPSRIIVAPCLLFFVFISLLFLNVLFERRLDAIERRRGEPGVHYKSHQRPGGETREGQRARGHGLFRVTPPPEESRRPRVPIREINALIRQDPPATILQISLLSR